MSTAGAGAGAGGRRVTVRSVSCRGVKAFVPFQKSPLYVAVSLGGRREKTNADPDGGQNSDWDGTVFAFDLDGGGAASEGGVGVGDGMLQFEVKAQLPLLGNKLVGKVSVPLADLAGGGDGVAPRHVSYQVCAPDGKANGKLSFTYAITGGGGGGAYQQPQQDPTSCCARPPPPPPASGAPYPAPAMASSVPHSSRSSSYPPLPSLSAPAPGPLYPPPPSSYPPPPPPPPPPPHVTDSHFPAQNFPTNSSYPPPPAAPPSQYISSYPPPPPSNYYPPPPPSNYYPPPPPPAGYLPPTSPMNPEFPAHGFPSPTSTYPPPPPPESGSPYPTLRRSAPCSDCSVDRALPPYMPPPLHDVAVTYPPPSGATCYPVPATWLPEEAAGAPYSYYPQPGTRYL